MSGRKKKVVEKSIKELSVIDLILFDHQYIKSCIDILIDDDAEKRQKLSISKGFLDAVQKHSFAEKKSVYAPLESNEELHFNILEAEIEHGIVDKKVKLLKQRLARVRVLKDETEAELKVLAELVNNHMREEESEMLPKMNEEVDEESLKELGSKFMQLRGLTPKDLSEYPILEDELVNWKDSVQKLSSQFLSKMDKYVENLKH
jgi:hemerythrin-like domain-containing protein